MKKEVVRKEKSLLKTVKFTNSPEKYSKRFKYDDNDLKVPLLHEERKIERIKNEETERKRQEAKKNLSTSFMN